MKVKFALILILSFYILGCNYFDRVGQRTPDNKLKSFFDFKPQSIWTYKEDSTGKIEKVTLLNRETYDVISNESDSWKYYNQNIEHTFSGNIGINKQIIGSLDKKEAFRYQMFTYKTYLLGKNGDSDYYAGVYQNHIKKDSVMSIWVSGNYYENVLYLKTQTVYYQNQYSNVDTSKKYMNEYWVASNKWIVRMIERSPQGNKYWSLLDCKVYQ